MPRQKLDVPFWLSPFAFFAPVDSVRQELTVAGLRGLPLR